MPQGNNIISIIIPVYNAEEYIVRCLSSVCMQTFTNFELILVNDASTDQSVEVANLFLQTHPNVSYQWINFDRNKGASAARNSGLDKAIGDYIYFIDADDELSHHKSLEIFAAHISGNYDFITADSYYKYKDGSRIKSNLSKQLDGDTQFVREAVFEAYLEKYISMVAWNKLYSKAFLLKNSLLFEDGFLHEDDIWSFKVSYYAKKALVISDVTYDYFQDNENSIIQNFSHYNIESFKIVIRYLIRFCEENNIFERFGEQKVANYFKGLCLSVLYRDFTINNETSWFDFYESFKKEFIGNEKLRKNQQYLLKNPRIRYLAVKYHKKYPKTINFLFYLKDKF